MSNPFATLAEPIPVTVVTRTAVAGSTVDGIALVRLQPPHQHADEAVCPACSAATDVRALLFDLLELARQGKRPPFQRVVVDASALADPRQAIDSLTPGKVAALGYRDHAVARNFRLADVL